jgi:hypothetical protein
LSAIFREGNGKALTAATWKLPDFMDLMVAEAMIMYNAMKLAIHCYFTKVIFESDCVNLVWLM